MNNTTNNELGFSNESGLSVIPEIINAILLSLGIIQMYIGIEILHPVYRVLFILIFILCFKKNIYLKSFKILLVEKRDAKFEYQKSKC